MSGSGFNLSLRRNARSGSMRSDRIGPAIRAATANVSAVDSPLPEAPAHKQHQIDVQTGPILQLRQRFGDARALVEHKREAPQGPARRTVCRPPHSPPFGADENISTPY